MPVQMRPDADFDAVVGPLAALPGGTERELTRCETPIDGLYLTGAAIFPGAGVWGAPGRKTALTMLG